MFPVEVIQPGKTQLLEVILVAVVRFMCVYSNFRATFIEET